MRKVKLLVESTKYEAHLFNDFYLSPPKFNKQHKYRFTKTALK